mmetsp:Transcript_109154/g.307753  ORF Transcript_109154/g.307753 Transcript_109154/m.307753 type:complete len:372 (-) Transcript_109154:565-1680(-)
MLSALHGAAARLLGTVYAFKANRAIAGSVYALPVPRTAWVRALELQRARITSPSRHADAHAGVVARAMAAATSACGTIWSLESCEAKARAFNAIATVRARIWTRQVAIAPAVASETVAMVVASAEPVAISRATLGIHCPETWNIRTPIHTLRFASRFVNGPRVHVFHANGENLLWRLELQAAGASEALGTMARAIETIPRAVAIIQTSLVGASGAVPTLHARAPPIKALPTAIAILFAPRHVTKLPDPAVMALAASRLVHVRGANAMTAANLPCEHQVCLLPRQHLPERGEDPASGTSWELSGNGKGEMVPRERTLAQRTRCGLGRGGQWRCRDAFRSILGSIALARDGRLHRRGIHRSTLESSGLVCDGR